MINKKTNTLSLSIAIKCSDANSPILFYFFFHFSTFWALFQHIYTIIAVSTFSLSGYFRKSANDQQKNEHLEPINRYKMLRRKFTDFYFFFKFFDIFGPFSTHLYYYSRKQFFPSPDTLEIRRMINKKTNTLSLSIAIKCSDANSPIFNFFSNFSIFLALFQHIYTIIAVSPM